MSDSHSTVAHQFEDAAQQKEATTLGMWVFLVTEILFFGGLFMGYIVYRSQAPAVFAAASHHLDIVLGGVNTAVLLTSSLTVALAVHAAQEGRNKQVVWLLAATIALAAVFLVVKSFEYSHKIHEGLVPGRNFQFHEQPPTFEIFFIVYFIMTGLHGVHVIIGIGLLGVIAWRAHKNQYSPAYNGPVEISGLYWHFVDIVWIFLYPLLYLIR